MAILDKYNHLLEFPDQKLLLIETMNGNKLISRYRPGNTIQDLIDTLLYDFKYKNNSDFNYIGISYNDRVLNDTHKRLEEFGINANLDNIDKVKMFARPIQNECIENKYDNEFEILIKSAQGGVIKISISPDNTIFYLKKKLEDAECIPVDQQRIIFSGKQLEDNNTISSYGIKADSSLHLVLRLRGGMMHEFSGKDGQFRPLESVIHHIIDIKSKDEILDS